MIDQLDQFLMSYRLAQNTDIFTGNSTVMIQGFLGWGLAEFPSVCCLMLVFYFFAPLFTTGG